jgi:hypothetical protein
MGLFVSDGVQIYDVLLTEESSSTTWNRSLRKRSYKGFVSTYLEIEGSRMLLDTFMIHNH